MSRRIKRNALNRGTAVYLGENRVRFIWPCGCTHIERMIAPDKRACSPTATARLVKHWRANGVTLEQCSKHPEFYSKLSLVEKLNSEHPQGQIEERARVVCQHCKSSMPLQPDGTLPFHGQITGRCPGSEQQP